MLGSAFNIGLEGFAILFELKGIGIAQKFFNMAGSYGLQQGAPSSRRYELSGSLFRGLPDEGLSDYEALL